MSARTFNFRFDDHPAFAIGHPSGHVTVCVGSGTSKHSTSMRMNAAEARAMAVALEAAATWAENVLETGLGESAVDAPAVPS